MMEDNNIIDYGEVTIPTSWDELTLKQYQEIERYYEDKDKEFDVREVLHIFTNRTLDEINAMPLDILDILLDKLSFITQSKPHPEPSNKIEIDGETYMVNTMEKMKTGEYISTQTVLKADKHNYAAILAILCRKEGEIYDSNFEANVLNSRIELFEKQPITKILPIITFFLTLYEQLVIPSLLSSQTMEAINLTRQNIETSRKNGEVSKRFMRSAMKTLKKYEKIINGI